jgi:hypothetical protein
MKNLSSIPQEIHTGSERKKEKENKLSIFETYDNYSVAMTMKKKAIF